jgi:hypothetical protein
VRLAHRGGDLLFRGTVAAMCAVARDGLMSNPVESETGSRVGRVSSQVTCFFYGLGGNFLEVQPYFLLYATC